MDVRSKQQIWGAITALNHLMASAWEVLFMESDDPMRDLLAAKQRMMAEMEPQHIRGVTNDERFVASQHAIAFLEEWWADMEKRIRHQTE